jgi:hypothetical protein
MTPRQCHLQAQWPAAAVMQPAPQFWPKCCLVLSHTVILLLDDVLPVAIGMQLIDFRRYFIFHCLHFPYLFTFLGRRASLWICFFTADVTGEKGPLAAPFLRRWTRRFHIFSISCATIICTHNSSQTPLWFARGFPSGPLLSSTHSWANPCTWFCYHPRIVRGRWLGTPQSRMCSSTKYRVLPTRTRLQQLLNRTGSPFLRRRERE